MTPRIIAVDWSGDARRGGAGKIALAEARDGDLVRLVTHITRERVVDELMTMHRAGDAFVAGLDFGFAMPSWYLAEQRFKAASELWRWLAHEDCAERLLSECARPYWGRPGKKRHDDIASHFRHTELAAARALKHLYPVEHSAPKSVLQIGGGGAVGTGSLRGMCKLHDLHEAGIAVWPFDDARSATVLEIYPRRFTGPVQKSREDKRRERLAPLLDAMSHDDFERAAKSEDAFDAVISAIEMSKHMDALAHLPSLDDPLLRLEGVIWWPDWAAAHDAESGRPILSR